MLKLKSIKILSLIDRVKTLMNLITVPYSICIWFSGNDTSWWPLQQGRPLWAPPRQTPVPAKLLAFVSNQAHSSRRHFTNSICSTSVYRWKYAHDCLSNYHTCIPIRQILFIFSYPPLVLKTEARTMLGLHCHLLPWWSRIAVWRLPSWRLLHWLLFRLKWPQPWQPAKVSLFNLPDCSYLLRWCLLWPAVTRHCDSDCILHSTVVSGH